MYCRSDDNVQFPSSLVVPSQHEAHSIYISPICNHQDNIICKHQAHNSPTRSVNIKTTLSVNIDASSTQLSKWSLTLSPCCTNIVDPIQSQCIKEARWCNECQNEKQQCHNDVTSRKNIHITPSTSGPKCGPLKCPLPLSFSSAAHPLWKKGLLAKQMAQEGHCSRLCNPHLAHNTTEPLLS